MIEFTEQEKWSWKLRTSTETIDYFWVNDRMQTTKKSDFFECVDDESSQRAGYFWINGEDVEIGVNNLDAQRKDLFGRKISQSILLRSSRKDEQRTKFLRKIFAEAICDASKDPVAAIFARELYDLWKSRDTSHSIWDIWRLPSKDRVTPVNLPSQDGVLSGWQYVRTPDLLRNFAAKALRCDSNILLLCAATNPVNRIWSIAAPYNIPTAVCAMTVKQDSPYTRTSHSLDGNPTTPPRVIPKFDPEDIGTALDNATGYIKRFLPIVIIVVLLSALAWWYSNSDRGQEAGSSTTALQSNDHPNNTARDAQSQETQREASQGVNP